MGTRHEAVHTAQVDAPAQAVYALVADVTRWPAVFGPSVYVQHLEHRAGTERFRIWATVNGAVKTWTSRRTLHAEQLRVTFEQEHSQAPVASMGGEWLIRATAPGRCEIELRHHFAAVGDAPESVAWIRAALDRNSAAELAALRRIAELGHPVDDVVFAFEDVAETSGAAAEVYDFIRRGDLWPQRLPHVRAARMTEDEHGVQELTMETVTADGATHTTSSVRLCLDGTLAYKQHVLPALLLGHSGQWTVEETAAGTRVTARHVVALNPAAVPEVLGPDRTLADARAFVREALGRNSGTTMARACAHAEAA